LTLILENTSIERLRLSSVQPQEFTQNLLDLWEDPRLCRHFHIPLQSASPSVLDKMRRRYSPGLFAAKVQEIQDRFPEAAITTDVIVGFPGEGDLEYEQTLEFCSRVNFADMHIFPYSVRPRTTAAHLHDKVNPLEKKERMTRMLALALIKSTTFRKRSLGQIRPVLWEGTKTKDGVFSGLTDNYLRVHTSSQKDLTSKVTLARLVSFEDGILTAENIL
jgi:threonylcarbamoyladenosine tRNA methylthiotransferase MtaB